MIVPLVGILDMLHRLKLLSDVFVACILALGGIAAVAISAFWFLGQRLPRARKGRIGIGLAISHEPGEATKRFADDFSNELNRLLQGGQLASLFDFIRLPTRIAESIKSADDALALSSKCRAVLVLWGTVRVRSFQNKPSIVLDLSGAVRHGTIRPDVQQRFQQEFSELLLARSIVPKEEDLLSFTFTSEWVLAVTNYIIGIAATVTGDLPHAERLYLEARRAVEGKDRNFPVYAKIRDRVPIRLFEIYEAQANACWHKWLDTGDGKLIEQIGHYLSQIDATLVAQPRLRNLRAIFAFLGERDVKKARKILNEIRGKRDAVWHLNIAFLHAYQGHLEKAVQDYRRALLHPIPPDVPAQVENFMTAVVRWEPERYQIHFCMALINRELKGDPYRMKEELEHFLAKARAGEFALYQQQAKAWLAEVRRELAQDKEGER